MIEPNFDLFLWILLIIFGVGAVANIIAGAMNLEKETKYGAGTSILGLIELFIFIWVMLK